MKPPICIAYMNINKVASIMILLATKDFIAKTYYRFKYLPPAQCDSETFTTFIGDFLFIL